MAGNVHIQTTMLRRAREGKSNNNLTQGGNMTTHNLHALDKVTWLNTIWEALEDYRENNIPENQPEYTDQWNDITSAMAYITEELGIDEVEL